MKIKKITSQNRRDFYAIYECDHCGTEHEGTGYDDSYFHQNVIQAMVCSECGKTANADYQPRQPKYAPHVVV